MAYNPSSLKRVEKRMEAAEQSGDGLNDQRLAQALEDVISSRSLIPSEQTQIDRRINEAIARQATLTNEAALQRIEIEIDKLKLDRDMVAWQLERAAKLAEKRKRYLAKLDTPGKQKQERERCARGVKGVLHWFRYWAWTSDPRPDSPLARIPFGLFGFQIKGIRWLWKQVFERRTDGQVVKSRDMGWSWLILGFGVACWQSFPSRMPFTATYGSRKQELVDKFGDMDTLFEKVRFMVNYLPSWMLPKGFNPREHATFMRLINPETDSILKGESSNNDFARAGRQTMVVFDEFAAWPGGGYAAYTAASESTRCRLTISTPQGKFNKFADLHFGVGVKVDELESHWPEHPWKDDRWYAHQTTRFTKVELAQEVDLDFEGSQAGRLFPMFDERIHVITWSEFVRFFGKEAIGPDGRPRIPAHWNIGLAQDVGTTEDHPNVTLMVATAAADSKLPGAGFVFYELCYPLNGHPKIIYPILKEELDRDNKWAQLSMRLISHEGHSERLTYETYGLMFDSWDTEQGYTQGYSQLQDYLEPDKSKQHPFRPQITDEKGKGLGRPMLYFIVADEAGGVYQDDLGRWVPKPAPKAEESAAGLESENTVNTLARIRSELPSIHIPQSEVGKPVKARRHFKRFDDAFDTLRALAAQFLPPIKELTTRQRVEQRLPVQMQGDNLKQYLYENQAEGYVTYLQEVHRVIKEDEGETEGYSPTWRRQAKGTSWRDVARANSIDPIGDYVNQDTFEDE